MLVCEEVHADVDGGRPERLSAVLVLWRGVAARWKSDGMLLCGRAIKLSKGAPPPQMLVESVHTPLTHNAELLTTVRFSAESQRYFACRSVLVVLQR